MVILPLAVLMGAAGCNGGNKGLPPLDIQAMGDTSTTATPLQETVAPTTTVTPVPTTPKAKPAVAERDTPTATATPTYEWVVGKDYAWQRAKLAASGKHAHLTGWMSYCDQLRDYSLACFYSDQSGQILEFAYDGDETYYVYYDLQDRRDRVIVSFESIDGSLLFPLKYCPDNGYVPTVVRVRILTPNGLEDLCDHRP